MKFSVITPTIYIPTFLTGYVENARNWWHDDVDYVIIGDKKSPSGTAEFCRTIPNCTYLDVDAQTEYMKKFPRLAEHIPFNCAERINVGMLWAYEHGTDLFAMINDDNFATEDDMIGRHKKTGRVSEQTTVSSSSGWYNVCKALREKNFIEFYHRGYPQKQKWNNGVLDVWTETRKIIVNEGLWIDNPDTDAITRMERPLEVKGHYLTIDFALARGTWSPLNSQNTTIAREAVPAYFQSPYIGRHSDIWAGYVIDRLAEHFNHAISFGRPLSRHTRSPHDLWKDLDLERKGMIMTDDFCDALRSITLTATSYREGLAQIIAGLRPWAKANSKQNVGMVLDGMQLWYEAFDGRAIWDEF